MTTQEIREMLDSTITANGKREISGKSLNAALNAILDLVDSKDDGSAVTILIPDESNWEADNGNADLIANNISCFDALNNQTEPMLIFLKRFGAEKPYAQSAMRMRHLNDKGEGTSFFAFGYPSVYTDKDKFGLLAYSDEMYKLNPNGTIVRINLLGDPYGTPIVFPIELTKEAIIGTYNHTDESVPSMLGQTYLPEIYLDGNNLMMRYPFGSATESDCKTNVLLDIEQKVLIIQGGYSHPTLGPIEKAVTMSIDTSKGYVEMTSDEALSLNDWTTVTNYKMTKKS